MKTDAVKASVVDGSRWQKSLRYAAERATNGVIYVRKAIPLDMFSSGGNVLAWGGGRYREVYLDGLAGVAGILTAAPICAGLQGQWGALLVFSGWVPSMLLSVVMVCSVFLHSQPGPFETSVQRLVRATGVIVESTILTMLASMVGGIGITIGSSGVLLGIYGYQPLLQKRWGLSSESKKPRQGVGAWAPGCASADGLKILKSTTDIKVKVDTNLGATQEEDQEINNTANNVLGKEECEEIDDRGEGSESKSSVSSSADCSLLHPASQQSMEILVGGSEEAKIDEEGLNEESSERLAEDMVCNDGIALSEDWRRVESPDHGSDAEGSLGVRKSDSSMNGSYYEEMILTYFKSMGPGDAVDGDRMRLVSTIDDIHKLLAFLLENVDGKCDRNLFDDFFANLWDVSKDDDVKNKKAADLWFMATKIELPNFAKKVFCYISTHAAFVCAPFVCDSLNKKDLILEILNHPNFIMPESDFMCLAMNWLEAVDLNNTEIAAFKRGNTTTLALHSIEPGQGQQQLMVTLDGISFYFEYNFSKGGNVKTFDVVFENGAHVVSKLKVYVHYYDTALKEFHKASMWCTQWMGQNNLDDLKTSRLCLSVDGDATKKWVDNSANIRLLVCIEGNLGTSDVHENHSGNKLNSTHSMYFASASLSDLGSPSRSLTKTASRPQSMVLPKRPVPLKPKRRSQTYPE